MKTYTWNLVSKYRTKLMGIAMIGVLICHWIAALRRHDITSSTIAKFMGYGECGVDIFLFLSGMGLYYSFKKAIEKKEPTSQVIIRFYTKRLKRLLPAYVIVALPFWVYQDVLLDNLGIGRAIYDLFLVSFITEGVLKYWYIGFIFWLYILFPLFYKMLYDLNGNKNNKGRKTLIILYLIMMCSFAYFFPVLFDNLSIALVRVPVFVLGIICGEKAMKKEPISLGAVLTAFVGTIVVMIGHQFKVFDNRVGANICTSFMGVDVLFLSCYILRKLEGMKVFYWIESFLTMLGSITLETYLLHITIRSLAGNPYFLSEYLFFGSLLPIIVGYLLHKFINGYIDSE